MDKYDKSEVLKWPIYSLSRHLGSDPIFDEVLSEKLGQIKTESATELHMVLNWMSSSASNVHNIESAPLTKSKINEILLSTFTKNVNFWSYNFYYVRGWLEKDAINLIAQSWIDGSCFRFWNIYWLISNNKIEYDFILPIFKKSCIDYSKTKSGSIVRLISSAFVRLNGTDALEGFKILSTQTPRVQACMWYRDHIPDEYVVKALKAISKLSAVQFDIKATVDLDKLVHLGPKSRLQAIKQLLGLDFSSKYNNVKRFPFKNATTKDDISRFLFPCLMKYTEDVILILKKLDDYMSNQKERNSNG